MFFPLLELAETFSQEYKFDQQLQTNVQHQQWNKVGSKRIWLPLQKPADTYSHYSFPSKTQEGWQTGTTEVFQGNFYEGIKEVRKMLPKCKTKHVI